MSLQSHVQRQVCGVSHLESLLPSWPSNQAQRESRVLRAKVRV